MRQSLGRVVLVGCSAVTLAWGGPYHWSLLESPSSLRVGESGIIRYECAFDTSAADYTIDFKPKSTEAYNVEILTQRDRITDGKRIQTFDLRVAPKHSGVVEVKLDALVRHTTFASIENATIGRDNVKKYDFNDEKALLPAVRITAQENRADLTGEIELDARTDANMVRSREPVHLSLFVRGKGNMDEFVPYEVNISGVRVFAEPPQKRLSPAREGLEGEIRQEFALVSEQSYDIPSFALEVFDTKEQRIKQLKTKPIHIEVSEGYEPSALLDPPDLSDSTTLKKYGLYTVLLLLGAVLGEAGRRVWKRLPRRKAKMFWDRAGSAKELSILLALNGEKRYEPILRGLEEGTMSLGEAKKKLSTLTESKEVKQ